MLLAKQCKCFTEFLNGMDVLKVLLLSVLVQIPFNIFINELAKAIEDASLTYNNMLRGDSKHFEKQD